MALVILAAVLLAFVTYFITSRAISYFIDNKIMSESAIEKRNEKAVDEFAKFVSENNLSITDTDKILNWTKMKKNVYISIYDGSSIILYFTSNGIEFYEPQEGASSIGISNSEATKKYILQTAITKFIYMTTNIKTYILSALSYPLRQAALFLLPQ